MSSLSQILTHSPGVHAQAGLWQNLKAVPVGEAVWFTLSLALCIAMGPFAAIPVAFAVFSLVGNDADGASPETVS